jgi:transcriptional regulator with XRE-family HTH domain
MLLLMCEVKKMSSDKTIGQIIAEAREKSNLSQRQLAKLAGINSSGLSKIEAGERDPNPKTLRKISNYIDVNYSDLMYKLGLGIEVSPLNPFIKDYYSKLKGEELNEAEVNVLGNKQNLEKLVLSCKEKLDDKSISESEKELLMNTIEDTNYQINTQIEIINLIQSLKVKERNKNAK